MNENTIPSFSDYASGKRRIRDLSSRFMSSLSSPLFSAKSAKLLSVRLSRHADARIPVTLRLGVRVSECQELERDPSQRRSMARSSRPRPGAGEASPCLWQMGEGRSANIWTSVPLVDQIAVPLGDHPFPISNASCIVTSFFPQTGRKPGQERCRHRFPGAQELANTAESHRS